MHYRMFVTTQKEPEDTPACARSRVFDGMLAEPGFCGESSRFGCPLADWFVIGGRWSGCLAETAMGSAYRDRLKAQFPKLAGDWYSDDDVKAHAEALDALWREFGGQTPSPFNRSPHEQWGYEDDALPLSRALYDALLAGHAGETCVQDGGHCEFLDLDDEPLDETFIGRKWLVVVDYHN